MFVSQASITAYRSTEGKAFYGPAMGEAHGVFGDPELGASPAAWWEEMRRLAREEGWGHEGEKYGTDVCLDCAPDFAGGYTPPFFDKDEAREQ